MTGKLAQGTNNYITLKGLGYIENAHFCHNIRDAK